MGLKEAYAARHPSDTPEELAERKRALNIIMDAHHALDDYARRISGSSEQSNQARAAIVSAKQELERGHHRIF